VTRDMSFAGLIARHQGESFHKDRATRNADTPRARADTTRGWRSSGARHSRDVFGTDAREATTPPERPFPQNPGALGLKRPEAVSA
jgi:hypothetical protein